ncbi:hypothetical protein Ccrd_012375 [Cynara cardunculus var. scolymus]|uniref:Uncharacterized protein n=1 Tax=Cynara cardunculus var. scolymus TaxID=59895 RepID=A0A103YHJ2_CYNCS|nr:hypothetical protein Ccrd_012375 [Cynara cardunculus var. scolymus]
MLPKLTEAYPYLVEPVNALMKGNDLYMEMKESGVINEQNIAESNIKNYQIEACETKIRLTFGPFSNNSLLEHGDGGSRRVSKRTNVGSIKQSKLEL